MPLRQREPLPPFALFRDHSFAVMSFVSATVQVGMLGLFLPVMIYLQSVLDFSALAAGLVMAPAMLVSGCPGQGGCDAEAGLLAGASPPPPSWPRPHDRSRGRPRSSVGGAVGDGS